MKIIQLIKNKAVPSFCTSNEEVLNTIIFTAKEKNLPCLMKSTSNQVNQYGGYTTKLL